MMQEETIPFERSVAAAPGTLAILLNQEEDFWRSSPGQLPRKYRKRKHEPADADIFVLENISGTEIIDGIEYVHVSIDKDELQQKRFKRLVYNGNKIDRFCTDGVYYHWIDGRNKGKKAFYRRDYRGNAAKKRV